MKEEELLWCKRIHQKIKETKAYSHIFKPDVAIASVRTLSEIEDLLDQNKYLTIFDWSLDINMLAEELIEYYSGQRHLMLIACDFSSWFEKRLKKKAVFKEEINNKKLQKCLKYVITMSETSDNYARMLAGEGRKKGGSHQSKKKLTSEDIQTMQNAINQIKDDSILLGVMRILKKWMPELEIAEDTTIDLIKLPKQCIDELKVLLGQM